LILIAVSAVILHLRPIRVAALDGGTAIFALSRLPVL
jgi:hypothetical protein